MKNNTISTTTELSFLDLCSRVDYWKTRANHFEELYNEERQENVTNLNNSIESAKKGVANALLFSLSATDNPDGSMTIDKDSRTVLAKSY